MGDLSEHFSRYEFRCRCNCGLDSIDHETLTVLEAVRKHFDCGVIPTSAHRCKAHNSSTAVGGSENSQHLYARAVDFIVEMTSPKLVQEWLKLQYPDKFGIGSYDTFTHLDTRTDGPARWKG